MTDMREAECPFCGFVDGFHERADFSSDYWVCGNCLARGPLVEEEGAYSHEDGDAIMSAKAIAAWNTRTTSLAAQDGLVEALTYLESEARRFAGMYPEASDGRNTFLIFADKIASVSAIKGDKS